MEVKLIKEHEDGSASFLFDCTPEELTSLVLYGIRCAVMDGIKRGEEWNDNSQANSSNTEF